MSPKVTVRIVCLHRGRRPNPAIILEREVRPAGQQSQLEEWFEANPTFDLDLPLPPAVASLSRGFTREAIANLRAAARGRWVDDRGRILETGREIMDADAAYVQHQLSCDCGVTERVTERDLVQVLRWLATQDTPERQVAPLGGIKRMMRLID